jgi:hypothetical protein
VHDGEVANRSDDNVNVRLILKYLYELAEVDTAVANAIRKEGFVNLFQRFIQEEANYEKAMLHLSRGREQLDDEIGTVNRDLSMSKIKQDVEKIENDSAILDSLNAARFKIEKAEAKLSKAFRDGDKLFEVMKEGYDHYFTIIELKDVLISDIVLPKKIKAAIQSKLEQEQIAQEFDFRLDRERKEAERKRIEGKGISDFQDMVAAGIEEGLLKWKAIEATLELAKSPNAKMVIIGAGKDGLPIILGNQGWDFPKPMVTDGGRQAATTDTASAGTPKE